MAEAGRGTALPGLTAQEAARRLAADGTNELAAQKRRNLLQEAWDVIRQPMLLLLLGAGLVNFLLAEPLDGIMLMGFVVVVIAISIYQEHRTERALAALRDLSSPRALVVRDGMQMRIAGRDVVRGDVVLLAEGDRVPADAALLDCANFSVDESALTGESVPVRKVSIEPATVSAAMGRPGGDATPWVFSGTLVVKGHGIAEVKQIGAGTELGKIGTALRTIKPERTPLQREIDRLVGILAVLGVGVAVAVVIVYGLTRGNWLAGVLAGIATAMALLPEEFPVVLTVFLALGAWRMSRKRVLTRRPPVIETLGSATVLCVDKTGTLTLNRMTVRQLIVDGQAHSLGAGPLPEGFHAIAEFAVLASPVDPFDPMDKAFKELGEKYLSGTEHVHAEWELVREYPLSEKLLALSHVWRSPDGGKFVIAAKGAPEAIADLCHFTADEVAALTTDVERATAGGQRVLAVACGHFDSDTALPAEQHDFQFEFLGLAGLHDPVRPGVAEAVAECRRAAIRTIMITGDYPGTALAIARDIGLDHAAGCITGRELDTMSDDELAHRIRSVSIFARMVPEQKLQLVRALQANGEVVGMTGDGVNDAPALRAADIGIAMGAHGTDVARESAALVITDDDFASIVGGVSQGRGIFDNLRKAMSYVIAVHLPIVGMSLVPVFVSGWPLVLLPVQIAFLELIIDPACSVVFESEEIDPKIMDAPPRGLNEPMFGSRVLTIAALQGLSVLAVTLGVYLWAVLNERPDNVIRSVTFVALVVGNLALILVNRSWRLPIWRTFRERRNRALKWILGATASLLIVVLTLPGPRRAFNFGPITPWDWLIAVAAGFIGVAWFEIYKAVVARR
ncbi:cation-translocating P-type ATPase [Mycobacterium sp. 852002-30065_SCH5024008]|uniref:cation-translocating P-type ATPase n=1 Tax=Mycobacterium sp. 852002-30065_SCH5024008 TaxID=1834088 RepID=UPI000802197B|nr:cation-translocating P-type ATPase [Mycobacterium sp. 852002-30065_SCH5024008]OBB82678.1 ATPase [Mycobacterium sp. 852002-30065_SCH5024008]